MLPEKKRAIPAIRMICLLLLLSLRSFSQTTVKGFVVNAADNSPLAGVSVVQQDTKKGTTTDAKGAFTLSVTGKGVTLEFNSMGFQPAVVKWNGTSQLQVKLEVATSALQDVVVVGYGTQKKINQTGSTQTLKLDEAVNQPVTNSGQLMYGRFAGVQLTQGGGLPGSDNSSIVIRGVGTFGSTAPLVVIDNIQYTGLDAFNNLAPSDIESISVLKDASASSIYGARGANGVIVVTTKKGKKGAMSVIYNNYVGFQKVTVIPQYLNAVDYATLKNERDVNFNGPTTPIRYTQANIQAMIDGNDPDRYSNTNWADQILRNAAIQNHYLSFTGGSDKTTFRASLGYQTQDAIVKGKFKSDRYTLSLNLDTKVKDWLTITNVTNAYWSKFKGPTGGADAITGETGIINQFQRSSPTVPVYYSNGQYGIVDGSYLNVNASFPITHPIRKGFLGDYTSDEINIADRIGIKADITKHLSFETSGSLNLYYNSISDWVPTNSTFDWAGNLIQNNVVNTLKNSTAFNYRLLNENLLRYNTKIADKHDVSFLLGHSIIYNRNDGFAGSLQGFPSDGLQEFNAGGVLNPNVTGGASEEAVQSFFSRLNYSYDGKYLLELNVRRDGSSKFGPTNRYGTFPSASAGWRISQEKFMQKLNWLNDLKLRGSWGITGNDNIGNYIFDQTYNANLDYFLGTSIVPAVAITALANTTITWETVKQYDIGIDASLFKNRLSITADYFNRTSTDVLYANFPIPSTIGVTNLAAQNAASMVNKGIELVVNYRGNIKQLKYSIGGSLSKFEDNKVTGLGDRGLETINARSIIRKGVPFNAYYGYKTMGIFQTAADVAAAPVQFGSNNTKPGDMRYADLSGPTGVPDGKVDAFDRTIIGNPYPKMIYNFNANLSYKDIDLSILFEGLNGLDRLLMDNGQLPMEGDRNNVLTYWMQRWTTKDPSNKYPRVGGVNNAVVSDFYIEDASYLRLKNIELGYTLPLRLSRKIGLNKLRFFASGQNILTFTKMKNFDPERARGSATDQQVPLYKVYTIGLNVKF